MKKINKIIGFGSILSLGVVSVCVTTSLAKPIDNNGNEYIVVKISGKDMIFANYKEATNYILKNKIKVNQEVKIGIPKFLDETNGIIDQDSLFDYKVGDGNLLPAYKMMNGKYTPDRKKALRTFLGRTHLVAQYYDGEKMHDGNSIGLKEAKDAIASRQLNDIVPWEEASLSADESIRINPFNKSDVKKLQNRALEIFKYNSNHNIISQRVVPAYLFKNSNSEIGIIPKNNKNLTASEIVDTGKLESLMKKWIKENVLKFNFVATIEVEKYKNLFDFWNPYEFNSYKSNLKMKDGELSFGKMKIEYKNFNYNSLVTYKDSIEAFLSHKGFWEKFKMHKFGGYNKWSIDIQKSKLFGKDFTIDNKEPSKYFMESGYDVSINRKDGEYGTIKAFKTTGKLSFVGGSHTLANFEQYLDEHLKGKYSSLINTELKDYFDNKKAKEIIKNNIFNKLKFQEKVNNLIVAFKTNNKWNLSNSDMLKSDISKKAIPLIEEGDYKGNVDLLMDEISNQAIKSNTNKLLVVNGTPIAKLNSKNEFIDNEIYDKISEINHENKHFILKKNYSNWEKINDINAMDFKKRISLEVGSNIKKIDPKWFADFKKNKSYKQSSIKPLLFFVQGANKKYKSINLSKILVKKQGLIYDISSKETELFFNNNKELKEKLEEINNNFFDPQLTYIIYNDNDEIIDTFKCKDSNLRFDDKNTIIHNAKAILSKYIKKDLHTVFVKGIIGKTFIPVSNKSTMVYNINWNNKIIAFSSFENVKKFIEEWVKINAKTIIVKKGK